METSNKFIWAWLQAVRRAKMPYQSYLICRELYGHMTSEGLLKPMSKTYLADSTKMPRGTLLKYFDWLAYKGFISAARIAGTGGRTTRFNLCAKIPENYELDENHPSVKYERNLSHGDGKETPQSDTKPHKPSHGDSEVSHGDGKNPETVTPDPIINTSLKDNDSRDESTPSQNSTNGYNGNGSKFWTPGHQEPIGCGPGDFTAAVIPEVAESKNDIWLDKNTGNLEISESFRSELLKNYSDTEISHGLDRADVTLKMDSLRLKRKLRRSCSYAKGDREKFQEAIDQKAKRERQKSGGRAL